AQRVADRRAESALERLRVGPAEPIREGFTLELEPLGSLKAFPEHRVVLSPAGPQTGLQTCKRPPTSRRRSVQGCGSAVCEIRNSESGIRARIPNPKFLLPNCLLRIQLHDQL